MSNEQPGLYPSSSPAWPPGLKPGELGDFLDPHAMLIDGEKALREVSLLRTLLDRLRRAQRALRTLSLANRVFGQVATEAELLTEICRILVVEGGYRLAWIGYLGPEPGKSVLPVAQAGFESGYLEKAAISWDEASARGRGPTGKVIRTLAPYVAQNLQIEPEFEPWREEAISEGYAASLSLPIFVGGQIIGALMVYAPEPDAFDLEELQFIEELCEGMARGIAAIRVREECQAQEAVLRRREAELDHARELARLTATVFNAVAHDLRNPLTAIHGYLELLEEDMLVPDPDRQQEYRQQIAKAADRIEAISEDLLDSARLSAGAFQLRVARFDMGQSIHAVIDSMKPMADKNGVMIAAELPTEPLSLDGDFQHVERLLFNLIQNAIKYGPLGGRIVVRARGEGDGIVCEVEDQGGGISEADVSKLFQPFGQLCGATKKGGAGLGLSICKSIVQAHGGEIGVRTVPTTQSTFWFSLPLTPSRA